MKKTLICFGLLLSTILGGTSNAQDVSDKLSMLEIVISNLVTRVEALEKRLNSLEKNPSGGVSKTIKKEVPGGEPQPKPSLPGGFESIGKGFYIKNTRFNLFGTNMLFTGEIANKSEKNYRFAKFVLEIYDDRDLLIKKEEFTLPDIPKETTKSFEVMLVGIESNSIHRYVVKASE